MPTFMLHEENSRSPYSSRWYCPRLIPASAATCICVMPCMSLALRSICPVGSFAMALTSARISRSESAGSQDNSSGSGVRPFRSFPACLFQRKRGAGLHRHLEESAMNNIEREQIIAPRAAGQSYARIADALNLSVNSVKSFCSDACRAAWWNAHRTQVRRKATRTFCCARRGMQFSRYGVTRRSFCSRSCASAARKREFSHDA